MNAECAAVFVLPAVTDDSHRDDSPINVIPPALWKALDVHVPSCVG